MAEALVSCAGYFVAGLDVEGLDVDPDLGHDQDFLRVVVVVGITDDHASPLPFQSEHCERIKSRKIIFRSKKVICCDKTTETCYHQGLMIFTDVVLEVRFDNSCGQGKGGSAI